MGNSPRDCGPGGQWLGFIFIWWEIVLMGSCLGPILAIISNERAQNRVSDPSLFIKQ